MKPGDVITWGRAYSSLRGARNRIGLCIGVEVYPHGSTHQRVHVMFSVGGETRLVTSSSQYLEQAWNP